MPPPLHKTTAEILVDRAADPQAVIDLLVRKKDDWKRAAENADAKAKLLTQAFDGAKTRLKQVEAAAQEAKYGQKTAERATKGYRRRLRKYKARYADMRKQKNWWKNAALLGGAGVVAMLIILMSFSYVVSSFAPRHELSSHKIPTSGRVQKTPARVLASVRILSPANSDINRTGSGTVIARGEQDALVLSVAHNFEKVGESLWSFNPDGTYVRGKVVALDPGRDLALVVVPADSTLARVHVPRAVPPDLLSGVGYTGGTGPRYRTMGYNSYYYNESGRAMWDMAVMAGMFGQGDSGGGVFAGDALVGVTRSKDDRPAYRNRLYAVAHPEVVAFLDENKAAIAGCGDWSVPDPEQTAVDPDGAPPPWAPTPDFPINTGQNAIAMVADLRKQVEELKKRVDDSKPAGEPAIRPRPPSEIK